MEIIDLIIKYFILFICAYFVCINFINYQENNSKKKFIMVLFSLISAINYTYLKLNIGQLSAFVISYVMFSVGIEYVTQKSFRYSLLVSILSFTICLILYFFGGGVLVGLISYSVFNNEIPSFFDYRIVDFIFVLIIYRFLRLKKFKYGLPFLKNDRKIEILGIIIIIICMLILLLSIIVWTLYYVPNKNFSIVKIYLWIFIIFMSIFTIIWIRRELHNHYKNKLNERNIMNMQNKIDELTAEIKRLETVAKISHKTNHEIDMLRNKFKNSNHKEALQEINTLAKKYSSDIELVSKKDLLQLTNIKEVDDVLKYIKDLTADNNIDFIIKINGSINYMIQKCISKESLTTLLSDHLKNAVIAIKNSRKKYRSITLTIGEMNNYYGVVIYDSGVDFRIDTLVNLGKKAITTYETGTGIGFLTTFATLNETKASLEIEEFKPDANSYTKAIKILFDEKNEYRITTYRAKELRRQNNENRIIINQK